MIKAIIFDCFGVLTSSSWKEFWDSLGGKSEEARELNRAYDGAEITKEEFFKKLKGLIGKTKQEIEDALFSTPEQKNTQLIQYIKGLNKQGYKLAILSNIATNWIRDELLTVSEQNLFDTMVFSFETGITKPDPKSFLLACEKLKIKPIQAILVDDVDRYCVAAEKVGMKSVLYQNFGQMRRDLEKILKSNS
jgi:epoxide hydrolase-like predicted phosphatase